MHAFLSWVYLSISGWTKWRVKCEWLTTRYWQRTRPFQFCRPSHAIQWSDSDRTWFTARLYLLFIPPDPLTLNGPAARSLCTVQKSAHASVTYIFKRLVFCVHIMATTNASRAISYYRCLVLPSTILESSTFGCITYNLPPLWINGPPLPSVRCPCPDLVLPSNVLLFLAWYLWFLSPNRLPVFWKYDQKNWVFRITDFSLLNSNKLLTNKTT